MLKENMSKKVRNVLSVAAISAAVVPFAVNAAVDTTPATNLAHTNGAISTTANITGNTYIDSNITFGTGAGITAGNGANGDYTIDLGGHTLTLTDTAFSVGSTDKVTIKNGSIICTGVSGDCLAATSEVVLSNVNVTSDTGDAVKVATGEITGGTFEAKTAAKNALSNTGATKVSGTTLKGALTGAAGLEISGSVTAPFDAIQYAKDGATVKVNAMTNSDTAITTLASNTGKVNVNISDVDFTTKTAGAYSYVKGTYTLSYDSDKVNLTYPTSIFSSKVNVLNPNMKTLEIKKANTAAFDSAREAWTKLEADKKQEITDKYGDSVVQDVDALIAAASDDIRDQAIIDRAATALNKMLNLQEITEEDLEAVEDVKKDDNKADNKVNNAQNVTTDVKTSDNVADKNPQTSDSILSYVGLAVSSLASLGVAAKKYLFR